MLLSKVFPSLSFEVSTIISNVAIEKEINPHIQINDMYCTRKIIGTVNLAHEHVIFCMLQSSGNLVVTVTQ